jgi:His/Glu/Gln/Arg/opine family amino acid ABC transporter permease subunit
MAWDWQVFCKNTTEGTIEPGCWAKGADITYLEWMFHAWGWTLSVAVCAWFVAVIVGPLVGTARTLPNSPWLVRLANAWVELFRNIPILVQLFIWYFVVPRLFPVPAGAGLPAGGVRPGLLHLRPHRRTGAGRRAGAAARASATPAWRWASPRRRPTATSSCRWRFASSCRRSPASR